MQDEMKIIVIRSTKDATGQWVTLATDDANTTQVLPWDWSKAKSEAENLGLELVTDEPGLVVWRAQPTT
jgi:hypothetical protein